MWSLYHPSWFGGPSWSFRVTLIYHNGSYFEHIIEHIFIEHTQLNNVGCFGWDGSKTGHILFLTISLHLYLIQHLRHQSTYFQFTQLFLIIRQLNHLHLQHEVFKLTFNYGDINGLIQVKLLLFNLLILTILFLLPNLSEMVLRSEAYKFMRNVVHPIFD